jgi:ribulose 1,5-bisphosphate carboxylase large subunit-like protein
LHCVARALRQAIDAVMEGIKVSDYAEEHEELKTALTKWGAGKTGFQV